MRSIIPPKDSYIELFMSLLKDQETPTEYDFWAAVWTVGAVVGRTCYIDRPRAPIYFNWYIVICAESGMTRKSTVINFAQDILEGCLPKEAIVLQTKTTPEKLWAMMSNSSGEHGYSHVVINISEMVTFFGKEGYALGMPILLTDLYDCPTKREGGGSLNYGTLPLLNPFVTFIAGSTPSWLTRAINPDVIEGGFTSRVIFVNSDYRKQLIFWPEELRKTNVDSARDYLRAVRSHAATIKTIQPDSETKAFLANWYRTRAYSNETYLRSFESREDSHILRLAGTIALSELKSSIGISEVELALHAITRAKKSGRTIFRQAAFDLKLTNGLDKIREVLLKRGKNGIKNWELYIQVKYHFTTSEFAGVMDVLADIGAVRTYLVPTSSGKGRPARYHFATPIILQPNKWNEIQMRTGMTTDPVLLPEQPSTNSLALTDQTSAQTPDQKETTEYPSVCLDIDYKSPNLDG